MPPTTSMTAHILVWLFSGITPLHLLAMGLVWLAVFLRGSVGFKEDSILRVSIGAYLICEVIVTLFNLGDTVSKPCTLLGAIAMFLCLGRLIRWLVVKLKKS